MDSACYRLSRIPQKFNTAKVVKTTGNSSYAQSYYASNPDAQLDTRPPKEKLEEIDKKLADFESENSEESGEKSQNKDDERFDLLVQQKSLRFLVFGENSPEAVQSMTALGTFYTAHDHPDSALMHLNKAQQTAKTTNLSEEDSFKLGLELADANMHSGAQSQNKQDKAKKVELAEKAIMPYAEYETGDDKLSFRRDLICAEIFSAKKKYEKAVPLYESAGDKYPAANPEKTKAMGDIYVKGAEAATSAAENSEGKEGEEKVDYAAKAIELYQKAMSVYNELGETKDAEKCKEFIESKEQAQNAAEEPKEENAAEAEKTEDPKPDEQN